MYKGIALLFYHSVESSCDSDVTNNARHFAVITSESQWRQVTGNTVGGPSLVLLTYAFSESADICVSTANWSRRSVPGKQPRVG
jgi:hypothetical protein